MPDVSHTARLSLSADDAWQELGDFGAVGDWHPLLAEVESDGNEGGDIRRATGEDGNTQVEQLDAFDDAARSYRYRITETQLPVENYSAQFGIEPDGNEASVVRWSARFDAKDDEPEAVKAIDGFIKAGTDALAERYG